MRISFIKIKAQDAEPEMLIRILGRIYRLIEKDKNAKMKKGVMWLGQRECELMLGGVGWVDVEDEGVYQFALYDFEDYEIVEKFNP